MRIFSRKWFPDQPVTAGSMADAVWLERDQYDKFSKAVATGIGLAFKG